MTTEATILGKTKIDPVGQALGTGYMRFESLFGISGLAKEHDGTTLELLAIAARHEGRGSFRNFIITAKTQYRTIKVWHVDNPFLPAVLDRYGFRPTTERHMIDGTTEELTGWRWDK